MTPFELEKELNKEEEEDYNLGVPLGFDCEIGSGWYLVDCDDAVWHVDREGWTEVPYEKVYRNLNPPAVIDDQGNFIRWLWS